MLPQYHSRGSTLPRDGLGIGSDVGAVVVIEVIKSWAGGQTFVAAHGGRGPTEGGIIARRCVVRRRSAVAAALSLVWPPRRRVRPAEEMANPMHEG